MTAGVPGAGAGPARPGRPALLPAAALALGVAGALLSPLVALGAVLLLVVPGAIAVGAVLAPRLAVDGDTGDRAAVRPPPAPPVVPPADEAELDELVRAEAAMADGRATVDQEWLLYSRNPAACRARRHPSLNRRR